MGVAFPIISTASYNDKYQPSFEIKSIAGRTVRLPLVREHSPFFPEVTICQISQLQQGHIRTEGAIGFCYFSDLAGGKASIILMYLMLR